MQKLKLYMVLLGCRPKGRNTEQHDVFFGIGEKLADLKPQMNSFWPDSNGLHIDAWREVNVVQGREVKIEPRKNKSSKKTEHLFFINLGGYRSSEFEEYHHKVLCVAENISNANRIAKSYPFFKQANLNEPGAASHIDDKFGFDVDEAEKVADLLDSATKEKYSISIGSPGSLPEDTLHIGYVPFSKLA